MLMKLDALLRKCRDLRLVLRRNLLHTAAGADASSNQPRASDAAPTEAAFWQAKVRRRMELRLIRVQLLRLLQIRHMAPDLDRVPVALK